MEKQGKDHNLFYNSNAQISIHNVNSKSSDTIELSSGDVLNLTTGSNQDSCSISIPSDFSSFTNSSYNLQSKPTKNITSKA